VRAVMDDDPARLRRYDGRAARPVSPMGDRRRHWEVRRDPLEIDGGAAAAPSRSPNDEQDEASQVSRSQSYVPAQVIDGKTQDFATRGIRQAARRCFGFDRSPSETTEPAHRSAARTR
jgi:hypothetical protein